VFLYAVIQLESEGPRHKGQSVLSGLFFPYTPRAQAGISLNILSHFPEIPVFRDCFLMAVPTGKNLIIYKNYRRRIARNPTAITAAPIPTTGSTGADAADVGHGVGTVIVDFLIVIVVLTGVMGKVSLVMS
jgi:hypothetical protein